MWCFPNWVYLEGSYWGEPPDRQAALTLTDKRLSPSRQAPQDLTDKQRLAPSRQAAQVLTDKHPWP